MRPIKELFVHCSATQPEWMDGLGATAKRAEIDRWHKARGWRGFGYHYLIDRDGAEVQGRPEPEVGAHVKGHNSYSLGVCLVGGHGASAYDKFSDHFTPEQERALVERLNKWLAKYPGAAVRGHNEVAAKGCPGFQVAPWWAAHRSVATSPRPVARPAWLSWLFRN